MARRTMMLAVLLAASLFAAHAEELNITAINTTNGNVSSPSPPVSPVVESLSPVLASPSPMPAPSPVPSPAPTQLEQWWNILSGVLGSSTAGQVNQTTTAEVGASPAVQTTGTAPAASPAPINPVAALTMLSGMWAGLLGIFGAGDTANAAATPLPSNMGCQPGTATGSGKCEPCSPGTYGTGLTKKCKECAPGYMSKGGAKKCTACTPGYYTELKGAASCKPCAGGYFSVGASMSCSSCPPGTYSTKASKTCTPCPIGTYNSKRSAKACTPCAQGTVALQKGSRTCTKVQG